MTKQEFDKKVWEFKRIFGFTPPFDRTLLLVTKEWTIDICELDRLLNKYIPEYDSDECAYDGKPNYSMEMAIKEKYGERASELITEML